MTTMGLSALDWLFFMRRNINRLISATELLLIFTIDVTAIVLTFKLSAFVRLNILPAIYAGFPQSIPFRNVTDIWWIFLVWVFFFYYEGLYTKRLAFWDEVRAICNAAFFSSVAVFAIASIGKLTGEISRTTIIMMGAASLITMPVTRISAKSVLRKVGLLKRRVLILGAGETGKLIARALRKEPNYGFAVIGFIDDDPQKVGTLIDGIKVHKGVASAAKYLKRCNITDIIVAMPGAGKERLQGLINKFQHKVDNLLYVPDMFGMAVVGTTLNHFFDEQAFALELKNNIERPINIFVKRVFDYIVGSVLLILLAVPILMISALIKWTSKGPAFLKQERIGRNGEHFTCYKFRTMYEDADERLDEILSSNSSAKEEWEKYWKFRDDPRVTKIGRFLRKTSLDELPQIFNVLMGEMSLVGPRPYLPREWDFIKDSSIIFNVFPGITGLWQVSGRSNTGYDYRIMLDSWYVRNWNLWLDIVVMLKTIKVVFRKEGAC
jgi:undecaprenyl-phosphate galactose phosphotransferase